MNLNSNFSLLLNNRKKIESPLFRVTVVTFEDKCNLNCGFRFAELLKQNKLFDVTFFKEDFSKNFLNLQSRHFFDFIDKGHKIIKATDADIVIWGYEEDGKIRINFQTENQYNIPNKLSFSLLDSLFIPLNFLVNINNFSPSLLLLIYGIIVAAIVPKTNEQIKRKPEVLKELINLLANDNSHKDLSKEFMPYIMNMIGKIYLSNVYSDLSLKDIKIIKNLFESALNNKSSMKLPIYYGCIYNNLAQLYEIIFNQYEDNKVENLQNSINNYLQAQRYINKSYPYDFGLISYNLALMYFEFWKHTSDIQSLRNAITQLREAEKVYTYTQFPTSWCNIEGLLGSYLTTLGAKSTSEEIMTFAIQAYQNQQKIYSPHKFPEEWANIQEKIGNIYYLLGKQSDDDNFMKEAQNYFNSAKNIYQELNLKSQTKNIDKRILKVRNYIG